MPVHRLEQLLRFVRQNSAFYRKLYSTLPEDETRLEAFPVVPQQDFWEANSARESRLLTGPTHNGVVYKSGGTTGNPKFSFYLRDEWDDFCRAFGRGMAASGLRPGERIGNLFYVGELYASFLFIHRCLELSPVPVLQFPIGGAASLDSMVKTVLDFDIETLAGGPTTIMAFAEHVACHLEKSGRPRLTKVLFGGESFYPDQRARLEEIFPGIQVQSIGCASVDAGFIGYSDESCHPDEHRAFGAESIVEILDEKSGEPITGTGCAGRLVVTNLIRALMPIIRYPSGDRAEWVDPREAGPDRKFRLLGRAEEGARVGSITLYYDDVRPILAPFQKPLGIVNYQLRVVHEQRKDRLSLVVAVQDPAALPESATQTLLTALHAQRPMLQAWTASGQIHPTRIDWVAPAQLAVNPRTGKLRRIMDER
ncbi:phenylacetate--CoA ligase family protein [Corallococcus terminator]